MSILAVEETPTVELLTVNSNMHKYSAQYLKLSAPLCVSMSQLRVWRPW